MVYRYSEMRHICFKQVANFSRLQQKKCERIPNMRFLLLRHRMTLAYSYYKGYMNAYIIITCARNAYLSHTDPNFQQGCLMLALERALR